MTLVPSPYTSRTKLSKSSAAAFGATSARLILAKTPIANPLAPVYILKMSQIFDSFEPHIARRVQVECEKFPDPSHDFLHVLRVVKLARQLAEQEHADSNIVLPAAYLHDVVLISKQDPRRAEASRLSADEADRFLKELQYPASLIAPICHAVAAHSFSAGIAAETLEAKIVQDADRLDGLGAIGIARCFSLGGTFHRAFYQAHDPFAENRAVDDKVYTLDHFYAKLLRLQERLQTEAGRTEGRKRTQFLQGYLRQLKEEII